MNSFICIRFFFFPLSFLSLSLLLFRHVLTVWSLILKGYYGCALGKNKQPAHAEIEKVKVKNTLHVSFCLFESIDIFVLILFYDLLFFLALFQFV